MIEATPMSFQWCRSEVEPGSVGAEGDSATSCTVQSTSSSAQLHSSASDERVTLGDAFDDYHDYDGHTPRRP